MEKNIRIKFKMITILVLSVLLIINIAPLASGQGLANTPWPSFRKDDKNTGHSNIDISSIEKKLKWSYETGGRIHSSPAIGYDGTLYIGSTDNFLHAIRSSGSEKWIYSARAGIRSSPAIDEDGTIYFGSTDNNFYAVQSNGKEKWHFTTVYSVMSSPVIGEDGLIYFTSSDGKLYAMNKDGEKAWNYGLGGFEETTASPAYGPNGTVYSGYKNTLHAVKNGSLRWKFKTGGKIKTAPAISNDGKIYIASDKLYCLNLEGNEKWNFTVNETFSTSPAIGPSNNVYIGSNDDKLYSLSSDGIPRWNFTSDDDVTSSPVVGKEGTVIFGSDNLYSLYPNGTKKWEFETKGKITSSPAIGGDGTIYFGSKNGRVYALGESTSYPSPPKNLKAEVEEGVVNLSWESPSYTGSSDIESYKIFRETSSGEGTTIGTVNSSKTYFIDETMKKGDQYEYYVKAKNLEGFSGPSEKVSVDLGQEDGEEQKDLMLYLLITAAIISSTGIVMTLKRRKLQSREKKDVEKKEGEEDGFYHERAYTCPHCGYSSSVEDEEKPDTCPRCNSQI